MMLRGQRFGSVVLLGAMVAFGGGCVGPEIPGVPEITPSAEGTARWHVDLNRVVDGVFRTYRPRCTDTVRLGDVVAFRNFEPTVPANVTALAAPEGALPLYSPNLIRPYQYTDRDDPENDLCESYAPDGSCGQRPHYSQWRYRFDVPGVYDWIDTHSTAPGRKVVDPYYGTVTFVGIDPSSPFGTVCVAGEDGSGCEGICCADESDCLGGLQCFKSEGQAQGRCLTPSE